MLREGDRAPEAGGPTPWATRRTLDCPPGPPGPPRAGSRIPQGHTDKILADKDPLTPGLKGTAGPQRASHPHGHELPGAGGCGASGETSQAGSA